MAEGEQQLSPQAEEKQQEEEEQQEEEQQQVVQVHEEECCTVLRLRGLPYQSTEEDIKAFFGPEHEPQALHICRRNGRATGEAFVEFASEEDAASAFTKKGQYLGHRYIECVITRAATTPAALFACACGEGGRGGALVVSLSQQPRSRSKSAPSPHRDARVQAHPLQPPPPDS